MFNYLILKANKEVFKVKNIWALVWIILKFNFKKNFDPFVETELEPVLIGVAVVEPRSILHNVKEIEENLKNNF